MDVPHQDTGVATPKDAGRVAWRRGEDEINEANDDDDEKPPSAEGVQRKKRRSVLILSPQSQYSGKSVPLMASTARRPGFWRATREFFPRTMRTMTRTPPAAIVIEGAYQPHWRRKSSLRRKKNVLFLSPTQILGWR